jgi:Asp-tRNA(Asn)/Glu-tRNA(Gln) amidotransferase A subunit family amidase
MSDHQELCYLSATDALELFRARALSPVELTESVLARADEVESTVNALCHRFPERALAQAREAETRYLGKGEPPRPLEGIPTAVKEEEPIAGEPWTQGSLVYKDLVADSSSPFAERIVDSGAIVHARTTAPEFSCAAFTQSRIWGVTRNPWNPEFAVGGSSGGSGASLASGTTTLASGSDIGGSIRIPASFNGVVGFKPPYGRVPQMVPFNLDTYCHCGPMARTVSDCLLFENVLAGPHPADIVSLRPKLELPWPLPGVDGLRIAVSVDLGDWPVDPEVRRNTRELAFLLADQGAIVEEVDLHLPQDDVLRAAAIHFHLGFGAWIESICAEHADLVTDYAAGFESWSAKAAAGGTLLEQHDIEGRLYLRLGELLDRYDALVCPTAGTRGLAAGDSYVGHGLEVGGRQLDFYFAGLLTPVFNLFSRCPVLSVPSGFADNGVPTGIQIVGRTYDDLTTFRVGAACERARPWLDSAARRPCINAQVIAEA